MGEDQLEERAVKEKAKYTEGFREQALEKVYTRGSRSPLCQYKRDTFL